MYLLCTIIAGLIRYLLMSLKSSSIHGRVEIDTPLNSFKRIKEGVFLIESGIDPYSGDVVHEHPIILLGHAWVFRHFPQLIPFIYILFDILTALILKRMTECFLQNKIRQQKIERKSYAEGTEELEFHEEDIETLSKYVYIGYLLNPFALLNCSSITTTVFSNFFLSLFFYFLSKEQVFLCMIPLALESCRSFYPFILYSPAFLITVKRSKLYAFGGIAYFLLLCFSICWISASIMGSWTFLDGTLGFIFFYRDLQPNIGLFWYFFTEMFDHFRTMFLITFQMNATILYLVPLSIKLRKDPVLLGSILVSLITIFKSYPCFGDIGLYLSLLPIWRRCWKFMAHNFIVFCFFLITSLILPTLWHLWIYAGSANANFYFGATLAFSTGQIFLVTDLLFAYVKREFCLTNGQKFIVNQEEAKIMLD